MTVPRIFERYKNMDSVIASNADLYALAVMKEAQQKDQVPGDIQVIGYDGAPQSIEFTRD
ncbi:MAG: hypothetical protein U5K84_03560 [Alkalibacterium sp.]|nr:hypothetical protein [Alkalibacterium sp.]